MECRECHYKNTSEILNLETAPPSNNYLESKDISNKEVCFPLKVRFCPKCYLVQAEKFNEADELFDNNYAYFSSYSSYFVNHAKKYVSNIIKKLSIDEKKFVIEIASNDGYLLQFFKRKRIPCLGIEPTLSTAKVARKKGIKVISEFLTLKLAKKLFSKNVLADLIIANNVLAHVPDINDFVSGLKKILKNNGTITFEFPTVVNLINNNLWDTVYHEHFSYLSLTSVEIFLKRNGIKVYDVEQIKTHGGSLRVFATHANNNIEVEKSVKSLLNYEKNIGIKKLIYYENLQGNARQKKYEVLKFLLNQKLKNKNVVGYGAAAKAATLFNYCGIKSDLFHFVVDNNPHKQKKYFPGSRVPIVSKNMLQKFKPDYIVILPWNLKDEIIEQLSYARKWNAKFVVLFPRIKIF